MENIKSHFTGLYENTGKLIQQESKILRLEIYERVTNLVACGVNAGIMLLIGVFAFAFLNLGAAFYLNALLDTPILGFVLVGLFYVVVLLVYYLFRKRISNNKIKNVVLLKLSKNMDDFDELLVAQDVLYKEIELSKDKIKTDFESLQKNLGLDDLNNENEDDSHTGSRRIITEISNFLLRKVVLRKSNVIVKAIIPIIANAFITSSVFDESKPKSLLRNLKLKLTSLL